MKEPTSIGTLVEDSSDNLYVKVDNSIFSWLKVDGPFCLWESIEDPKILYSERDSFVKWLKHLADNANGANSATFLNNLAMRAKHGEHTVYGSNNV